VSTITTTSRGIGVCEVEPFTLSVERPHTNRSTARSVEEPLATVMGSPRLGVIEGEIQPFLMSAGGPVVEPRSIDEPANTVLTRDHMAIIDAFLVKFHGGEHAVNRNYSIDEPVATLDTSNRFGLVEAEPFIMPVNHGALDERTHSVDDPMKTITAFDAMGIVDTSAFLLGQQSGAVARDVNEPVPTVAGKGAIGKVDVEPFIFNMAHTGKDAADGDASRCRTVNEPLSTIAGKGMYGVVETEPFVVNMKGKSNARSIDDPLSHRPTSKHQYLAEPYIVKFYGNGDGAESIDDPLSTVTGKDRFALCIPSLGIALDIRFRMLQPHELAAAMSFPKDYEFTGNRENKVKQIGNAVPLKTAKALCTALLGCLVTATWQREPMPNFWFKFEWDAWRDDRQLKRCCKETRGFWVDCIAEMESQETYFLEGTPDELCRVVVATSGEFDRSIAELSRTGAATVEKSQGVVKIISRRLLRKLNLTEYNRLKKQEQRERDASSDCQDPPSKDKSLRVLDSPIGEVCVQPPHEKPELLSEHFQPSAEMVSWANTECPGLDLKTETDEFIGFWREIALKNNKRTLRGWNQTWKNRMRDQFKKLPRAAHSRPQPIDRSPGWCCQNCGNLKCLGCEGSQEAIAA
jgi:hypothetical protein